jgi:uncharacterized sulfatase
VISPLLRIAALTVLAALALVRVGAAPAARPNILWITCEDTSPLLGSYGDTFAVTPNLDALAREGVRYTQAFAYTGVCAPSRSSLITGVLPLRLGSHHMRSTTRLPDAVKCFTEYLRAAGYYTSNNVKEDYNFRTPASAWHESSNRAHWRNRAPGQPFFSVFNFTVTHQSQIFASDAAYARNTRRLTPEQRRDPARVFVPPIHPDTPEFRREWARHYENVTAMDYQVGDVLAELAADGLAEDTIVFFFSDHGTGMPSIKMYAWGPSLQVPLLVRFPAKWSAWSPVAAGGTTDRLVTFVDFAPTVLSLAGVDLPAHFQGTPFLGPRTAAPRTHIFGGKDRQGECPDTIRYVRDARFQYNRNFRPDVPFGQYMSYNWQHASMRAWEKIHLAGQLTGPAARFFAPKKPTEELYDVARDPWQVHNLAADPRHAADLARLRALLRDEMLRAGDLGLLPERELHARSAASTPYALATDPKLNPLPELLRAAEAANARDPQRVPELTALLRHSDSALRWWGALGLVDLGPAAAPARAALRTALADPSSDVRLTAAHALAGLGELPATLQLLETSLGSSDVFERFGALLVASRLGPRAAPLLPVIRGATLRDPAQKDITDYIGRMVGYLPERLAP